MTGATELSQLKDIVHQILARASSDDLRDGFDESAWRALETAGMTLVAAPEELGGGGGTLAEAGVVVRAAGRHGARLPIAETSIEACRLLAQAQLPVAHGPLTCVAGNQLKAAPVRSGWVIDGTAHGVPYARVACRLVIVVMRDGEAVVMSVDPASVQITERASLAGEPRDDLAFRTVTVPGEAARAIRPSVGDDLALLRGLSRVLLIAGAADRILEMVLRHVAEREQFGRPIARFQVVQHAVAELAGEVAAVSTGGDAALLAVRDSSRSARLAVASAVLNAKTSARRITRIAHQLHGAIGTTNEHPLPPFTRRLRAWVDEAVCAQPWVEIIASDVLSPTAPGLWEQVVG